MLGSILIGLETPRHAADLTEMGIRWARRTGATLVGLGIVDEPGIRAIEPAFAVGGAPGVDPVYRRGYDARMKEVRAGAEQLVASFAARCDEAGVKHEEVTANGPPHEMIVGEAQSADLILMSRAAHFRFAATGDEGDETLKKVLKNSSRPVVVLPETERPAGPVVIAYDGSLHAARTLAAFEATGLAESGQVHIIGCVVVSTQDTSRHVERARRFLARHGIEAIPHVLDASEHPARRILGQVRALGAGLLVMGCYGHLALREFFVGSVTRAVLGECPVPIFLYH